MRLHPLLLCLALAVLFAAAPASAEDAPPDKAPEHKLTNSKSYVEIDPIYTTVVEDNRPVGMLMVGIGMDIPDDALRTVATRSMPVLRDAYVRSLMGFSATNVRTSAQPDVAALAARLQSVTDRALGHKGARVLLAQIALRVTK
jgi:flagellar basal body-associated protein FliL